MLFAAGCEAAGVDDQPAQNPSQQNERNRDSQDVPPSTEALQQPAQTSATLIAVGDILVHTSQYISAYSVTDSTYSFDDHFMEVAPLLKEGDWVIGNLETTFAGPEVGYSGYPMFNTPDELADALKNRFSTTW